MKRIFICTLLLALFTSCLSTKKTNYFQGEKGEKSEMYKFNNTPYKLQVNDIISINITSENPELVALFNSSGGENNDNQSTNSLYFQGYSVDIHGNIRIPYIGELNVLGYTEEEVRQKIEIELKKFIKNPESIFVTVKLSGIQFVVTGEVGKPGTLNLQQNQVTIIEAIANAGEISQYGNRENVQIFRKSLDGVEVFNLNMTDIEIFDDEQFFIQPNDVVYVEALKRKSWGFGTSGFQTFTILFSSLTLLISTGVLIKSL